MRPGIRPHALASVCSVLLTPSRLPGQRHGAPVHPVRKRHISMTMDIYSHVLPSMQQETMDKLDDLFKGEE